MAHEHLGEAKSTQRAKVQSVVGHTKNYVHPTDKADNLAYTQNQKLDPLTLPTTQKEGPETS